MEKVLDKQYKMALLIDAENISQKYIKLIMDELSEYGEITHKRVYGDFSVPSVASWKQNLVDYAMTPVFQFNYTTGKNASDSAMVIDAMDILYSGKVDGFCLVTSDSDFTKLAIRLREAGKFVVGMGEQKTPSSLVSACQTFKYLDLLYKEESDETLKETIHNASETIKEVEIQENNSDENSKIPDKSFIEEEINAIITGGTDDNEWVNLATIGNMLVKRVPGFDPRNYGYKKLKDFVETFDRFETNEVANPKNEILTIVYVKVKSEK